VSKPAVCVICGVSIINDLLGFFQGFFENISISVRKIVHQYGA
jgi:hypothetical protein